MGNYTQLAVLGRQMRARRGRNPRPDVHAPPRAEGPGYTCPKCGDASVAPSWCDRCQLAMADPGTTVTVIGDEGSLGLQRWGGAVALALSFALSMMIFAAWPTPLPRGRSLEPLVMGGVAGICVGFLGLFLVAYFGPRIEAWWRGVREDRAFASSPDTVRGPLHVEGRGAARRVWIETASGPVELEPKSLRARVDLRLEEGDEVEALGALEPAVRQDGYRSERGTRLAGEAPRIRRAG